MTQTAIHGLKATGKRYEVRDSGKTGLIVRIGADGSKHFGFRGRIKSGLKGRSPEYRATYGRIVIGAGGKPDKAYIQEAKSWAVALKGLTDAGVDPREQKKEIFEAPTLTDIWERYKISRRGTSKAQSSQEADERIWRLHIAPTFGPNKVAQITTPKLVEFYDARKVAGRNANQIMALLSVIMGEAVRSGAISTNPCREIKREKESSIDWERLNSSMERLALIEAAYQDSEDAGLIVELALMTGARKKEILNAKWENISAKEDGSAIWLIPITKQKRAHRTNIPPKLYKRLREWQTRQGVVRINGWVFSSPVTPEKPREDTRAFFDRIRDSIGKPRLRFHDLRHDFGTQLALAGMSTTDIMAAMGHSNIQTTMRYISLAEAEMASMASGMREQAIEDARVALGTSKVKP